MRGENDLAFVCIQITNMNYLFILTQPVIAIRSKYYVSVLLHRLKVKMVAHIAPALEEMSDAKNAGFYSKRRSEFYRYSDGGNIKNMELVKAIDALLPGTSRIIRHPIWPLLSMRTAQEADLIDLAKMIEAGLQQYIIIYDEITHAEVCRDLSKHHNLFKANSKFLQLIDRRGLDELTTLLIAIKLHEMHGVYRVSYYLREIVIFFFIEISLMSEFDSIIDQLYRQTHEMLTTIAWDGEHKHDNFLGLVKGLNLVDAEQMLSILENHAYNRETYHDQYSNILRGNRLI